MQAYKRRASILSNILLNEPDRVNQPRILIDNHVHLDCASTAYYLFKKMINKYLSFIDCNSCTKWSFRKIIKQENYYCKYANRGNDLHSRCFK